MHERAQEKQARRRQRTDPGQRTSRELRQDAAATGKYFISQIPTLFADCLPVITHTLNERLTLFFTISVGPGVALGFAEAETNRFRFAKPEEPGDVSVTVRRGYFFAVPGDVASIRRQGVGVAVHRGGAHDIRTGEETRVCAAAERFERNGKNEIE